MLLHVCDRHPAGDLRTAETRQLGVDGASLEIDLCEDCAIELEQTLAPWVEASRTVSRVPSLSPPIMKKKAAAKAPEASKNGSSAEMTKQERQTIRAWANENGYTVQPRGSIAEHIIAAYRAAVAPSS